MKTLGKVLEYSVIILLAGIVGGVMGRMNSQDHEIPDYYKEQFQESLEREKNNSRRLDEHKRTLNQLRYEIHYKDTVIDNATGKQLDSLFSEFWNATGFH